VKLFKKILLFSCLGLALFVASYALLYNFGFVYLRVSSGEGASMQPTIKEGMVLKQFKKQAKEGDIISFECTKTDCLLDKYGRNHPGFIQKRLVKIREDGAYWVEGDNKNISYDSTEYGWILPSERKDVRVIELY
jgi:signal peptidase I